MGRRRDRAKQFRSRPKYQALGLGVRARARGELGLRKAVEDARAAVEVARGLLDPAVLVECLSVVLKQDGTDELSAQSQLAVKRVLLGVTDEVLRRSFLARVATHGEPGNASCLSTELWIPSAERLV